MTRSLAPGGVEQTVVRLFGLLVCLAVVVPALPRLGPVAGGVALLLAAGTAWLVWRWVPEAVSGARQRRPVVAGLWVLAALLALAQVGRLSAFMAEPDWVWGSVVPDPLVAGHACLSAYVVAADISRRGTPNLYDERFYPAFAGDAAKLLAPGTSATSESGWRTPSSTRRRSSSSRARRSSSPTTSSPFAPDGSCSRRSGSSSSRRGWRGGSANATDSWHCCSSRCCWPLSRRCSGCSSVSSTSPPLLLSIAAMISFEERRPALGGGLLAVAIVSKLSPAFLLVYLLARRRWREVAWTLGACAVFSGVALAVLGWAPFESFLSYQLPRIQSGEAFSFYEDKELVVSRNLGIPGLVTKLHFLGVPGMTHALGAALGWLFTLLLLWLAGSQDVAPRAGSPRRASGSRS